MNTQQIVDKTISSFSSSLNYEVLKEKFDITESILKSVENIFESKAGIIQTQTAIDNIPSEGIIINTPGQYYLTKDLVWNPTTNNLFAIKIMSSDVLIDFKGYQLSSTLSDNKNVTSGIIIGSSSLKLNNVQLKNGSIINTGSHGIIATYCNNLDISDLKIKEITINNTEVKNLTPSGINVSYSNDVSINNCIIDGMEVTSAASAGLQLLHCNYGSVTQCSVNNCLNHDGSVQGYSYIYCLGIFTNGCNASYFKSHFQGNSKTLGHTVIGFVPMLSAFLVFENCSASNLTGCCDDCHGMSLFITALIDVTNFSAADIIDGVSPLNKGAKATGLEVYGFIINISDSTASKIVAINPEDLQSTGFSAAGWKITFTNCKAEDIKVITEANIVDPTIGHGTGFGWAPDPRKIFSSWNADHTLYQNCEASKCSVGFDSWKHTNSVWKDIKTSECQTNIWKQDAGVIRTLKMDKCSESPSGNPTLVKVANVVKDNTFPPIVI